MEYLLALDAGTSSMRGGIFDRLGTLRFLHQVRYQVHAGREGRVEQDARTFLDALDEIIDEAGRFCNEQGLRLSGAGLASQRSSLIAVDADGMPLADAIMWQDKRTTAVCEEINAHMDTHTLCGMRAAPVFTGPKILWLRRDSPALYHAAHKLLGVHELLLHRLTGRFVTDASVASRSCMLDLRTLDWSPALLDAFGAKREKLCQVVPPGSVCGNAAPHLGTLGRGERLPVVSAGGDQQCAVLGLGMAEEGAVTVNCGTGSYAVTLADTPRLDPDRNVICNVSAIPGKYVLEASTLASGMVYDWFTRQFCRSGGYREADEEAALSPPGAGGVLALPDLMGRGMPDWDADARGGFYNIGFYTTRGDLARAVLEGLAGELCDCVELLSAQGARPRRVVCSGGLSKSALFNQIQADMYGVPVQIPAVCEATLRGVWASTAAALGWYPDSAAAAKTGEDGGMFLPDPAAGALYRRANLARKALYGAVSGARLRNLL